MARRSSDGYFEYTSADEVRSRAASSQRKLAAKKVTTEPVVVTGRKLVQTWWGQAWVKNLERYADFANRLSRGRSYVRAGAIIDLKIEPGQILAKVQGSRARPYTVQIAIRPLPETAVRDLAAACSGQLTSLEQLLDGQFPAELAEKFMVQAKACSRLPEIAMNCSCPDGPSCANTSPPSFTALASASTNTPNSFSPCARSASIPSWPRPCS